MTLLYNTELSLQGIAIHSGYSSVELMKRRFRQLTWLTRTGFRHAHTGGYRRKLYISLCAPNGGFLLFAECPLHRVHRPVPQGFWRLFIGETAHT